MTRPPRSPPLSETISHFVPSSRSCPSLGFLFIFLNRKPCPIRFGFSSPVNRPCHRSVFLAHPTPLFLSPDVSLSPGRAGCLSAPAPALHLHPGRWRGGARWAGPRGRFRFLGLVAASAPPSAGLRLCIYYIYVCIVPGFVRTIPSVRSSP